MMNMNNQMGEKEILNDLLSSQKFTTSNFNTYAGECKCESLRNEMLNILKDEHAIQAELFQQMESRGWYPTKAAPENEIQMVRDKFSNQ